MPDALLVAEPEPETRAYLERQLRVDGFDVLGASASADALALVERARPSLVLSGGLELCSLLRAGEPAGRWDPNVPVIVLADVDADPLDRVRAFERGADDVVERPVFYIELVARIKAVLRRAAPGNEAEVLDAGAVRVDRRTRRVTFRGTPVALAGKEFELAAKLATEPTRVFTKSELLRDVWGFRCAPRTRTLDSHASRLRRKLCEAGAEDVVVNVWGVGRRVERVGRRWRKVASLCGLRHLGLGGKPSRFRAFGPRMGHGVESEYVVDVDSRIALFLLPEA